MRAGEKKSREIHEYYSYCDIRTQIIMLNEFTRNINSLSHLEKLKLIELLWDSVTEDSENIPVPEWHKKALDERYKSFEDGTTRLTDWNDLHNKLLDR
ncbi:MAG: hypothetical protein SCALA702_03110 [Melioribacteraceae bacterium]|nr:MAG: hypothetical protein SCALA702_03110 [Melioribacteraceae bacterium]